MTTNTLVPSTRSMLSNRWIAMIAVLLLGAISLLLVGPFLNRQDAQAVQEGDIVMLNYTLLVDGQTVYFSTDETGPVEYALGNSLLLPDFEAGLVGMRVGEMRTIRLAPEQAYGPYRHELVWTLDIDDLPEGMQPVEGRQIKTESESGAPLVLTIIDVTDTTVTLDANHPLSGHNLTFEVELVEIGEGQGQSLGNRGY